MTTEPTLQEAQNRLAAILLRMGWKAAYDRVRVALIDIPPAAAPERLVVNGHRYVHVAACLCQPGDEAAAPTPLPLNSDTEAALDRIFPAAPTVTPGETEWRSWVCEDASCFAFAGHPGKHSHHTARTRDDVTKAWTPWSDWRSTFTSAPFRPPPEEKM